MAQHPEERPPMAPDRSSQAVRGALAYAFRHASGNSFQISQKTALRIADDMVDYLRKDGFALAALDSVGGPEVEMSALVMFNAEREKQGLLPVEWDALDERAKSNYSMRASAALEAYSGDST